MASVQEIYNALVDVASLDPSRLAAATTALQAIEKQQGAFAEIFSIAATKSAPLNIRQMAIIQFKNNGVNNWRSKVLFTEPQRENVRKFTISLLDEPDDTITRSNAEIMAKLFRIDGSTAWPTLIPELGTLLRGSAEARFTSLNVDPLVATTLRRSLYNLNRILKEIGTVRMPSGVKNMSLLTSQFHDLLMSLYIRFSTQCRDSIRPDTINWPQNALDIEIAHLVYKCLGRIVLWVYTKARQRTAEDDQVISLFFTTSSTQFQAMLDLRVNLALAFRSGNGPARDATGDRCMSYLTRHVRTYGKVFRKLQQPSLPRFVALPGCSNLIMYYWNKVVEANSGPPELIGEGDGFVYPARVLLQGMVLFKEALSQWSPTRRNQDNEVLSQSFVENAVRLIVTRFLPLKAHDLGVWESDPEQWINSDERDEEAWEFEIRPCAERVLLSMASRYPDFVIPFIKLTFDEIISASPATDLDGVLRTEAVYCAVGRCARRLGTTLAFDQWLSQVLIVQVQNLSPPYRILKRRIAWVLGKFTSETDLQSTPERDAKIWEVLLHLLQDQGPSSDLAVRLSAAISLRECVDAVAFNPNTFNPFLARAVQGLMALMAEAEELESKRRVALTLNHVIQRMETQIVPFMPMITGPIPQLWENAGEDYMFKTALLELMKQLVSASKDHSAALQHMVVPLVQESLRPEARLRLDEDGIALWLAALRNAVTIQATTPGGPALFGLLPGAIELLSENLDLLGSILSIIDAYLLLDAPTVLQAYSLNLHRAFGACMTNALSTNAKDVLVSFNLMVQLAPSSNLWAEPMHTSGLFQSLLHTVINDKGPTGLVTEHIYLFARMVLQDTPVFLQLVAATAPAEKLSVEQLLNKLLDQWWRKFDNMAEPRCRKLVAMGMGRLVASGRAEVLERLPGEIFNLWLDVLGEMKEALGTDEDENHLYLYWKKDGGEMPESMLSDSGETIEESRRRQLYARDPVQTTLLTGFLSAQLGEARMNAAGGPNAFQSLYLAKTDPVVLQQLEKALAS